MNTSEEERTGGSIGFPVRKTGQWAGPEGAMPAPRRRKGSLGALETRAEFGEGPR